MKKIKPLLCKNTATKGRVSRRKWKGWSIFLHNFGSGSWRNGKRYGKKKKNPDHSQAFLGAVQHGGQAGEKALQVRSQITGRVVFPSAPQQGILHIPLGGKANKITES